MPVILAPQTGAAGTYKPNLALTGRQRAALMRQAASAQLTQLPKQHHSLLDRVTPDIVSKALGQIGSSLVWSLPGLGMTAYGVGGDIAGLTQGDYNFSRSREIGVGMGKQIAEDFKHPLRNPGYLLLDLASIASIGAGTAARFGAAGRVGMAGRAARLGGFPPEEPLLPRGAPLPPAPGGSRAPAAAAGKLAEEVTGSPSAKAHAEAEAVRTSQAADHMAESENPFDWNPSDQSVQQSRYLEPEDASAQVRDAVRQARNVVPEPQRRARLIGDPENRAISLPGTEYTARQFPEGHWRIHQGETPVGPHLPDARTAANMLWRTQRELNEGKRLSILGEQGDLLPVPKNRPRILPPAETPAQIPHVGPWLGPKGRFRVRAFGGDAGHAVIDTLNRRSVRGYQGEAGATSLEQALGHARQLNEVERRKLERGPEAPDLPGVPTLEQLQGVGLDEAQARELTGRMAEDMRSAYSKARAEGRETPKHQTLYGILKKHTGDAQLASEIYTRLYKSRGGTVPPTSRELFGDMMRAFLRPEIRTSPRMQALLRRIAPTSPAGMKAAVRAEGGQLKTSVMQHPQYGTFELSDWARFAKEHDLSKKDRKKATYSEHRENLSRNPLVRTAQYIRAGTSARYPTSRAAGMGRRFDRRIEFEQKQLKRIEQAAAEAGIIKTPTQASALEKELAKRKGKRRQIGDYVDTMNQAAQMAVLFTKPAYIPPNLIGQLMLSTADHAWNPFRMLATARIQRELYGGKWGRGRMQGELSGQIAQRIKAAMQEGIVQSIGAHGGASKLVGKLHGGAADIFNRILDTPFRDNAFISEARRHGFKDADSIRNLVLAEEGTPLYSKFLEVAQRANKNIIDYGRLGKNERAVVRRIVFFYPWFKGATMYGAHFFAEHPAQAALNVGSGREVERATKKELGPVPSYLEGAVKLGERNVPGLGQMPTIFNPQSASILGTPGQVVEAARGALVGKPRLNEQLTQFLTPAASAAVAATTRIDPFTGAKFSGDKSALDIAWQELKQNAAIYSTYQNLQKAGDFKSGERDPSQTLFPYTSGEAWGKYLTGVTPRAVNTREARSRAFAEQRGIASVRERERLKNKDYRDRFAQALKEGGVSDTVPPELTEAFAQRSQRDEALAAINESKPGRLTPLDRLQADLTVLVMRGVMDEDGARQLMEVYADADPRTISSVRRKYTEQFFGGGVISAYGKVLKQIGKPVNIS